MRIFYTLAALLTFATFNAQYTKVFEPSSTKAGFSQKEPVPLYYQIERDTDASSISDIFANGNAVYSSEDFTLSADADISQIVLGGIQKAKNLPSICTGFVLYIYKDDNGKPAGIPGDGKPAVLKIDINAPSSTAPNSPYYIEEYSVMAGFVVNIAAATGKPFHLQGNKKYWLVFAPKLSTNNISQQTSWYWISNKLVADKAKIVGASAGVTNWSDISEVTNDNNLQGLGFYIIGEVSPLQCPSMTSLFEDFESYETGNIVPKCWARLVGNDNNNQSIIFGTAGNPASSGNKMLYQYAGLNDSASGTIVVLPEFSNVNAGTNWLRFKAKSTGAGSLDVGYVTDPANASSFVNIRTLNIRNTEYTAPDATYSVAVPNTIPADARLAIRNYGTAAGSHYWDDIYWETLPACIAPTDVVASEVTKNSAKISWTSSVTLPSNGYEIYYSTNNTFPTSTTPATVSGITGNSATLNLSPSTAYYVWVRSACSGSETSDWTATYVSLSTLCDYPSITSVTGATICPNTAATLSVAGDAGATFTWYDAATGGNAVGTGTSFTTPALSSTTTYYVSSSATASVQSVGKAVPSSASTNTTASGVMNVGILFDAQVPFTLESVTLYPILGANATVSSLPGTAKIEVLNSAGAVVHSKTVSYIAYPASSPVAQVVNLGFPILAGTNYRLRINGFGWSSTGVAGFKIENVGAGAPAPGYPFILDGIVTLKSGVITAPPTNTPNLNLYHFFYDWKISTKCESPRVSVTATVGCLAVSDSHTKDTLKVYPNPFKEILSITNTENVRSISIIDAAGRVVKTTGKVSKDLNLSELKSGLYIVNLHYVDGNIKTFKVIKK